MLNILVVEDDRNLQKLISETLSQNGYNAFCASDGDEGFDMVCDNHIDLVISDIMMPKVDGYEFAESLRKSRFNMPVLMITARSSFDDKKKGFVLGVDDYMVKPIDIEEMVLRVKALLRRSKIASQHILKIKGVVLDYNTLTISKADQKVLLPKKEFYLLFKLLSYPGQIFTRMQLMEQIWGVDSDTDERTVDVHIKRLREKTKLFQEFEIVTIRGLGYKAEKKL